MLQLKMQLGRIYLGSDGEKWIFTGEKKNKACRNGKAYCFTTLLENDDDKVKQIEYCAESFQEHLRNGKFKPFQSVFDKIRQSMN